MKIIIESKPYEVTTEVAELLLAVSKERDELKTELERRANLTKTLHDLLDERIDMAMDVDPKEGFYYLSSPQEPEPTLVHGYYCSDMKGEFVFGFNTHDGGDLVPLSDLTKDTKITPVEIKIHL